MECNVIQLKLAEVGSNQFGFGIIGILAMTIFNKPRLTVDWVNVDAHHMPNILSQEIFLNVCFTCLCGNLRSQFVADQDGFAFLREFLLIWT